MSDWRPIETAPFDGTTVILLQGNKKDGDWSPVRVGRFDGIEWASGSIIKSDGRLAIITVPGPTHWMPLPELPRGI